MKPLVPYLLLVFALACLMLAIAEAIDPPKPVLLIDKTPAAAIAAQVYRGPPVPVTVCIRVLPTERPPGFIEGV
jgi:hypothetical protein